MKKELLNKATQPSLGVLITLMLIYTAVLCIFSYNHELYRDEVVPYSIIKESHSLFDVSAKMRNYGHPILYHTLLFGAYKIYPHPIIIKILSVIIAVAGAWIFLKFSPFRLYQKILLIFSFYPLYVYGAINRSYGLAMLLIFLLAHIYQNKFVNFKTWCLLLILLTNTHAQGAIIVIALTASMIFEFFFTAKTREQNLKWPQFLIGLGAIVAGFALFIYQTRPDASSIIFQAHDINISSILWALKQSLLLPGETFYMLFIWNNIYFETAVIFAFYFLFLRTFPVFLTFALSVVGMSLFSYLIYSLNDSPHHQGFIVLLVILCSWITHNARHKFRSVVFNIFCVLQCALIIWAVQVDLLGDFSSSKKLAELLKEDQYKNAILIAEPDYLLEPLPYYVENKSYIYREERFGTYTQFTNTNLTSASLDDLLLTARNLKHANNQPILIVIGHELSYEGPFEFDFGYDKKFTYSRDSLRQLKDNTMLVAEFEEAFHDENYKVYRLKQSTSLFDM